MNLSLKVFNFELMFKNKLIMKKIFFLILIAFLAFGLQLHAQEVEEKNSTRNFIEENNIPKMKYDKFWDILEKNYISYSSNEKWEVLSDTLAYVFEDDSCSMRNEMQMRNGILLHRDGKCRIAISPAFDPMEDKKLPIPYKYNVAKEYIFSRIANRFGIGEKIIRPQNKKCKTLKCWSHPIQQIPRKRFSTECLCSFIP